jgi:hypothetical protein
MTDIDKKRVIEILRQDSRQLSVGGWTAIISLIVLLVVTIICVSLSGTDDLASGVSGSGTTAMIFGVLFTIVVGVGLMGLIFYSSRRGYDDPPATELTGDDHENASDPMPPGRAP